MSKESDLLKKYYGKSNIYLSNIDLYKKNKKKIMRNYKSVPDKNLFGPVKVVNSDIFLNVRIWTFIIVWILTVVFSGFIGVFFGWILAIFIAAIIGQISVLFMIFIGLLILFVFQNS
tara:strand:+ start:1112 stop:1462 length:351 start_codon:yes stop_codon:yes gene_type:complete